MRILYFAFYFVICFCFTSFATLILDQATTNVINITNEVTVGSTTVINTNIFNNTFETSVTNNITVGEVTVTNNITSTFSPTVTNSFNPTFSPNLTNNFSPSFSSSFTGTFNNAFSPTVTNSFSPTFSPNVTNNITVGDTTVNNTNILNNTFNTTVTNNITIEGVTITNEFTPTFSPTVTNIFTPSFSATVTNSFNPSFTPTVTNNFSPSFTPTVTNNFSPSFSSSFTGTFNNTFSPNLTNNITVGSTTVNNTNIFTFNTTVTNNIQIDPVTVTNNFSPSFAPVNNVTNIYLGDFTQTIITNLIDQFTGVNVFSPTEVSTNVTGTWTISLTTNYAVGLYYQTGNITSVVFSVDSTNDVALGEVLFQATTNSLAWPTNGLTWAAGAAPELSTGQWSILYFRAWRDSVHAVYVGGTP